MKRTALTILSDTAAAHHSRLLRTASDHALFETAPPTVSGKPATAYRVRIDAIGDEVVKAREDQPILPPSSCPERHINIDGSFCPYWAEAEDEECDVEACADPGSPVRTGLTTTLGWGARKLALQQGRVRSTASEGGRVMSSNRLRR